MGTLYIVATPIGNLEDITLRAIRVLGEVDKVYAEDTRETKKIFNRHNISTPLESMNARTEKEKTAQVLELLSQGNNVAYVSDAGTPGVSDPGEMLVKEVYEKGYSVETIPGASALTAALSIAGVPASEFVFLGFLPTKKGREKIFKEIAKEKRTVVFYESPHRIMKALNSLSEHIDDRKIVLARELTKIHEEVLRGSAGELLKLLDENPKKQKGEFVVIVAPK